MAYLKIVVSLLVNTTAISYLYLVPTGPEPYFGPRSFVSVAEIFSKDSVRIEKAKRPTDTCKAVFSGAYETRTRHLLTASQTL